MIKLASVTACLSSPLLHFHSFPPAAQPSPPFFNITGWLQPQSLCAGSFRLDHPLPPPPQTCLHDSCLSSLQSFLKPHILRPHWLPLKHSLPFLCFIFLQSTCLSPCNIYTCFQLIYFSLLARYVFELSYFLRLQRMKMILQKYCRHCVWGGGEGGGVSSSSR